MTKKVYPIETVTLDSIVGGGQAIGTLADGRKVFVWGGLPGEIVKAQITKKKSKLAEAVVVDVVKPSKERIEPRDPDSFLSTSPWQIMNFDAEQHYKATLIEEAFELHDIVLPDPIEIFSDGHEFEYRNKVEFSWYWNKESEQLDLAFFRRGSHSKVPIDGTSLAKPSINHAAVKIRNLLRQKNTRASDLKTLLLRCNSVNNVVAQLYVKVEDFELFTDEDIKQLGLQGLEVIYSNPKSPASVITKRLQSWGQTSLTDRILGVPFNYAVDGFFQVNLPVYEQALGDMQKWVTTDKPTIDLYSGVGTIGLTIGSNNLKLIECNESAVKEMRRNVEALGRTDNASVILAPSESVLEHICGEATIIVDPPRAGLHNDVIDRLLETMPKRIIYLSCNPVTQARDIARLCDNGNYGIAHHQGYNFFPKTPHIEHLIILEKCLASID